MIITRAREADIGTIMRWRAERARWLGGLGEDQWSIPLPRSAVAATVLAGTTWMVWDGTEPIATCGLTAYADFEDLRKPDHDPMALWYPEDDPGDALYISKMIVTIVHSGQGIGAEMLAWADH